MGHPSLRFVGKGRGWVKNRGDTGRKRKFPSASNLSNKGFLVVSLLLLTCNGASVLRFSSWNVRCKGEAFPTKYCKLKKFNVVQPKTSIVSLFVREILRSYKSGRITREPYAILHINGQTISTTQQFTKRPSQMGHPSLRFVGKGRGWVAKRNSQVGTI